MNNNSSNSGLPLKRDTRLNKVKITDKFANISKVKPLKNLSSVGHAPFSILPTMIEFNLPYSFFVETFIWIFNYVYNE